MENKLHNVLITEKNISSMRKKIKDDYNLKKLLGNNNLDQSQSIRFGNIFQDVIKDFACSCGAIVSGEHFLDIYNKGTDVKNNKGHKDMDIFFEYNNVIYYFECKTNLDLDSEKSKATNKKVIDIIDYLGNREIKKVVGGVLSCWYEKEEKLTVKVDNVFFMKDLFNILKYEISKDKYYNIMKEYGKLV